MAIASNSKENKLPVVAWLLLAATTALFVYVRLRLLTIPLERDEGEYAYAGQQLLHGGVPYRNIYNMKFPGVYYCYALLLALFGNTIIAIRFGALLINLLTAFFLLKTGEKLKNLTTGIFAAATYIVLSSAPHFHGIIANAEHFVNLFIAISAYFLFAWIKNRNNILLLFTGIAAGLACLMKQHGAYFIAVAVVTVVIYWPRQKKNLPIITQNIFTLLAGFILIMILLFVLVLTTGTLNKFIFLTIKYGSSYISYTTFSQGITHFFIAFANDIRNDHPFWVLALTGVVFSYKLLAKKSMIVLLLWLVLSIASVFPGYYFRDHYFLLMTPVSAVYLGLLFDYLISIKSKLYSYLPQLLTIVLFMFAVVYILIGERRIFFIYTPAKVSEDIYHCNTFNEAVTVADTVRKYLPANRRIFNLGCEPELYFYTNSVAASAYMYLYPMTETQPWRDSMLSEYTHQAILNKPGVIIASSQWQFEISYRRRVLIPLMASGPGYYLKGICYKTGNNKNTFLWNTNCSGISADSIIWAIYIRKGG